MNFTGNFLDIIDIRTYTCVDVLFNFVTCRSSLIRRRSASLGRAAANPDDVILKNRTSEYRLSYVSTYKYLK